VNGSFLKKIRHRLILRREIADVRDFFDASWYLKVNSDVSAKGVDPVRHYICHGWKEGRNPTLSFDTNKYLSLNPDVAAAGYNPFVHYIRHGIREGRRILSERVEISSPVRIVNDVHARAFHSVQDQSFPLAAEDAENILVIIVPEHNAMSGGIYSFFSIAKTIYNLRFHHNYFVLLMTRPNKYDVTYTRQRNFRNSEDVFRFEQILRCRNARRLYIHIPEYAAPEFIAGLHPDILFYLKSREQFYINILNQKIDIMPSRDNFDELRAISDGVSQSVAHHAYFNQEVADRYDLPTMLLPAYTDLSNYEPLKFENKEKLIIYSPDEAPWRNEVLEVLRRELPDYKLQEIRDITFDKFMDLATRCRFSITFGEGFDGYLAQPIHQGGVSFAVFNDEFFPSSDMLNFVNIFSSSEDFIENIASRIRVLESDPEAYRMANTAMCGIYAALYSREDYVERVLKLVNRNFEYYPLHLSGAAPSGRL